ncbi:L-lactate dehydrogenase [[Mycoplasma] mobile]|uniref:L-lactate dehydrogenase n=1 Tax=Mycoplasma mobile (strain ATCC 43663 / 163K / NCTC 11711) TaxID=267748 RepID=LDH_MYCM1|nr:L-lactate dehydrogenase [[Mycoplasma] mobile]Q6KIP9.1 RecName: Full=L-lactate dehydrogenase; Short=L-LDH [Mycoplasma mobile 163K]AAT27527.1 l-lactate dehydrogenase [Mycoplasma mobile 163K]
MDKKIKRVAMVGAGLVGVSVLYSCMNRGLAEQYGIIDINDKLSVGHSLDFEDASAANNHNFSVGKIEYSDLKDYDVVVITAGRPQKPGETRLEMVADNAKIMSNIAKNIKKSGFKGVSIVVANPVDVMTFIYQHETGFDKNRVISSGTSLDSARLRFEISKKLKVHPKSVQAFVLGEHGDSSVSVYSAATVSGKSFNEIVKERGISKKELEDMHTTVYKKAYEIINRKGSTYFGIGSTVAELVEAILTDSHAIFGVGVYLTGQYGVKDLYIGVPTVLGSKGVVEVINFNLTKEEQEKFVSSATILKGNIQKALEAIKG